MRVGYIGIESQKVDQWRVFAEQVIGFNVLEQDGCLICCVDGRDCRVIIRPGSSEDIFSCGLLADDVGEFDKLLARLDARTIGHNVGEKSACALRGVERFESFADENDHPFELALGNGQSNPPFTSKVLESRFLTEEHGLGHAVFGVADWQLAEEFAIQVLSAKISDRIKSQIGDEPISMSFTNLNGRHHSLAFVQSRRLAPKRLQHFMVELASLEDLGRTYERVQSAKVPIVMSLGQHTNDRMLSFYCMTPSGIPLEVGWGGVTVDHGADDEIREYNSMSIWGHKFNFPGKE